MSRTQRHNRILAAALALLSLALCACGSTAAAPEAPGAELPPQVAETAVPTPQPAEFPETKQAAMDLQPEPETTEAPEAPFTPDLAARERVEDSFFDDSAFIGNSLVQGLEMFGGLGSGDFYAVTSTSVVNIDLNKDVPLTRGGKGTMLEALFEKQYGKIYVLLGINEISFEPDYFAELYGEMLDKIAAQEPDAEIYIMGLTPVTEKKSGEGWMFSTERIAQYNEQLYALALERGCRYLNMVEALADENGFLPEEQSTDGIHMTQDKYMEWADYLRTHYA